MFGYNPVPKPSHSKSKDKPKKVNHNRNKPKLKDRGKISPEVYEKAYIRSKGRCERCGWKDGSFDKTGQKWRLEAAHLIRRRNLEETTAEDIAMLCGPQVNTGTCHDWIDHTRQGREWAENLRNELIKKRRCDVNKEIKFRGICIAEGEMKGKFVYGDLLQRQGKTYISPQSNRVRVEGHIGKLIIMHEVDPETIGQYTGLKDKNGKEIYEGDIFKAPHDFGPGGFDERRAIVRWHETNGYQWNYWLIELLEVIGNIYETREVI